MHKVLLLFLIMIASASTHAQTFQDKYYRNGMYVFDGIEKIQESELFETYKSDLGLGTYDEMVLTNRVVTEEGKSTSKYEMHHKGFRVEGALMNVIGDKGVALLANGMLTTGLNVDNVNIIDEADAVQAAIDFIGANEYVWEDSLAEAAIKEDDPNATRYPQDIDLIIAYNRGNGDEEPLTADNFHLCYKVPIVATDPVGFTHVYVNANDGSVYATQNPVEHDYTAGGTVHTWYNGIRSNVHTRTCSGCFNFWLHDVGRNIYTTEWALNPWQKGWYNKDNNNTWEEEDTKTAATSHWGLQVAHDYYSNRYGRHGTDYSNKRVHIRVGGPPELGYSANAGYWEDKGNDIIGLSEDGTYPGSSTPGGAGYSIAALDILGHEYTHGMVRESSELGILGEDFPQAKGLNEGIADVFGFLIERTAEPTANWTIGEAMGFGTRQFQNPNNDVPNASPSIYYQPGYWNESRIHEMGGVLRKWFHLLSNGGNFNGVNVSSLGMATSSDILYVTFNWWVWSTITYPEFASQMAAHVKTDWGNCTNEHKQTINALRAVGFTNVGIPMCVKLEIDGPHVVDALTAEPVEWSVRINDIPDPDGTISWIEPEGWNVTTSGNMITLTSFDNVESQPLIAKYTTSGGTYYDTLFVHFNEDYWVPMNNLPTQPISHAMQIGNKVEGINVYPNPASNSVTLELGTNSSNSLVEIFDLNGKLIQSLKVNSPKVKLNTSGFRNGIYLIKVMNDKNTTTTKLTISH